MCQTQDRARPGPKELRAWGPGLESWEGGSRLERELGSGQHWVGGDCGTTVSPPFTWGGAGKAYVLRVLPALKS